VDFAGHKHWNVSLWGE